MADDKVAAELATIRERWTKVAYVGLKPDVVPEPGPQPEWLPDVPRLLGAVEAVLATHQPGQVTILGSLCGRHESHRYFSITGSEAADVTACTDCTATVYVSCDGCGPHVRLDSCPVRSDISRALLGEDGTDG